MKGAVKMGTSYRYKCDECGYEEEFFIGGSYMSRNYGRRVKEAEEEMRSAAVYGKYGETIQHMMTTERDKSFISAWIAAAFRCRWQRKCH